MADHFEPLELDERLFTSAELEWIRRYGAALDELTRGQRVPKTDAQVAFLAVAHGHSSPSSPAEGLWVRFLLSREVNRLRAKIGERDALLDSVAGVRRSVLIQELGADFLERSEHPSLLRVGADHYLKDDPTDPAKAMSLAFRASQLGDGEGSYIVAMMYEHGIGTSANRDEAKKFYRLAAERGIEQAKAKISERPPLPPGKYDHLHWVIPNGGSWQSDDDGRSIDDFDAERWERIMGGPDDTYFEREA